MDGILLTHPRAKIISVTESSFETVKRGLTKTSYDGTTGMNAFNAAAYYPRARSMALALTLAPLLGISLFVENARGKNKEKAKEIEFAHIVEALFQINERSGEIPAPIKIGDCAEILFSSTDGRITKDITVELFNTQSKEKVLISKNLTQLKCILKIDLAFAAQDEMAPVEIKDLYAEIVESDQIRVDLLANLDYSVRNAFDRLGISQYKAHDFEELWVPLFQLQENFDQLQNKEGYVFVSLTNTRVEFTGKDKKYGHPTEGKFTVYVNPSSQQKLEWTWWTCRELIEGDMLSQIKVALADPNYPCPNEEGQGKIAFNFYFDNYHNKAEVDRTYKILVGMGLVNSGDEVGVGLSRKTGEDIYRYPNYKPLEKYADSPFGNLGEGEFDRDHHGWF